VKPLIRSAKSWPRISIVTPCLNHAEFIEQTIDSVLSQGYPNLEYILIDGGSDDGSAEAIRRYEAHLSYWCSEPDDGFYHAVNKGFSHATGELMGWLNSDDIYCPWTLWTVGLAMQAIPQCRWLTTLNKILYDVNGIPQVTSMRGYSKESFLDGRHFFGEPGFIGGIQQESTFWRRDLWEAVGGLPAHLYMLAGDFALWSMFFDHAEIYAAITPLGGPRTHPGQKHNVSRNDYRAEAERALATMRERNRWSQQDADERDGYVGRKIKKHIESPDKWTVEEYRF